MNEVELKAENDSLKQQLEAAIEVNALSQAKMVARAISALSTGVAGDDGLVHASMTCVCLNCGAAFNSSEEATAHDAVCPQHPAAIRAAVLSDALKATIGPLELYHAYGWADRDGVIRKAKDALEKLEG